METFFIKKKTLKKHKITLYSEELQGKLANKIAIA